MRKHSIQVGSVDEAGNMEQCQKGYGFDFGSCFIM